MDFGDDGGVAIPRWKTGAKRAEDSTYLRGEDRRAPVHKGGLKRIQLRAEEVKLRNRFMEL